MSTSKDTSTPNKTALLASIPILGHMGIEVEQFDRGFVKLRLPFAANINHVGTIYAGSLFSLAETPGGLLFNSVFDFKNFVPVIAKFDIKFIKPARTDITVDAGFNKDEINRLKSELKDAGKARFALSLMLKDENSEPVAQANGYYSALRALA